MVLLALGAAAPVAQAQTAWLFGEQHDQPDHQRQTAMAIQALAGERRLHAVVLEMAERGRNTRGLPLDASEAQAQAALQWDEAWPWVQYRDVVMSAVRAGVPVYGGNLPPERLRAAAGEAHWDSAIPAGARQQLIAAVRDGHCGLLPESQFTPMARMQLARDRSLAEALNEAARNATREAVVVMLSGAVHASHRTGVPLQLAAAAPGLPARSIAFAAQSSGETGGFDEWRAARTEASRDHCAELQQRSRPGPAGAASAAAAAPAARASSP